MFDMSHVTKIIPCNDLDGSTSVSLIEHDSEFHVEHDLKMAADGLIEVYTYKLSPEYTPYPVALMYLEDFPVNVRQHLIRRWK